MQNTNVSVQFECLNPKSEIMATKDYDHEILSVESIEKEYFRFVSPFSLTFPLISLPHIVLLSAQIFFSGWHIIGSMIKNNRIY